MADKLHAMLTYKRPHGGDADQQFVDRFIAPTGAKPDDAGNMILRVGDAPVLWCAHTDTVHKTDGRQTLVHGDDGKITSTSGECLGADDTAGCWLLLEMIRHDVPGLYIFHRGEEVGGIGSGFIAHDTPELLDGIEYAVAFDRKGFQSVVTHQYAGRTASDTFAQALGDMIGLGMSPDDGGTFTDTALYAGLVPECTNVSVGYAHAHTAREELHEPFLRALARALCAVTADEIARLPVDRDPSVRELKVWGDPWNRADAATVDTGAWADLYELVMRHPEVAAELLAQAGYTARDVLDEVGWLIDEAL